MRRRISGLPRSPREWVLFGGIALLPSVGLADPAIAYLAVTDGYWQAWVMDADGARPRAVTRSAGDKTRVSWVADGRRLLVTRNDGVVVTVDIASGRESPIRLKHQPVLDAVISPDGRQIAYSFSTAIDGNDLWIADLDGSNERKVVRMPVLQHEPQWAPDGRSIYFLSGDGGQAHDIWRVTLNSGSPEQITVGSLYHFDIAVAADGSIAYSSNRDGNYEIYVERGQSRTRVTEHPALDARPSFSPDAQALVFESSRSGAMQIWKVSSRGGDPVVITSHEGGARGPSWRPSMETAR